MSTVTRSKTLISANADAASAVQGKAIVGKDLGHEFRKGTKVAVADPLSVLFSNVSVGAGNWFFINKERIAKMTATEIAFYFAKEVLDLNITGNADHPFSFKPTKAREAKPVVTEEKDPKTGEMVKVTKTSPSKPKACQYRCQHQIDRTDSTKPAECDAAAAPKNGNVFGAPRVVRDKKFKSPTEHRLIFVCEKHAKTHTTGIFTTVPQDEADAYIADYDEFVAAGGKGVNYHHDPNTNKDYKSNKSAENSADGSDDNSASVEGGEPSGVEDDGGVAQDEASDDENEVAVKPAAVEVAKPVAASTVAPAPGKKYIAINKRKMDKE